MYCTSIENVHYLKRLFGSICRRPSPRTCLVDKEEREEGTKRFFNHSTSQTYPKVKKAESFFAHWLIGTSLKRSVTTQSSASCSEPKIQLMIKASRTVRWSIILATLFGVIAWHIAIVIGQRNVHDSFSSLLQRLPTPVPYAFIHGLQRG